MKKRIKTTALFLTAALLICTLFAGCGSAKSDSVGAYDMSGEYTADDYEYALSENALEDYDLDAEVRETVTEDGEIAEEEEYEAKIIRNAQVNLEADDAKECYAQLLDYAKSLGGYESSMSIDTYGSDDYEYVNIGATLKIPPESLDAFLNKTGEVATVTYSYTDSDEITEEYYDVKTRLETKEKALDSYYALLEKAETMEDIITVQTRIDNLTTEIEALKGKLRLYDSKVSMSTVTLNISQVNKTAPSEKEFEWDSLTGKDFLSLIKNGFLGVTNFLWSMLQWLAIIIISCLPLILIAAIIIIIVRAYRKKHPKKQADKRNTQPKNASAPTYEAEEKE